MDRIVTYKSEERKSEEARYVEVIHSTLLVCKSLERDSQRQGRLALGSLTAYQCYRMSRDKKYDDVQCTPRDPASRLLSAWHYFHSVRAVEASTACHVARCTRGLLTGDGKFGVLSIIFIMLLDYSSYSNVENLSLLSWEYRFGYRTSTPGDDVWLCLNIRLARARCGSQSCIL